MWKEGKQETSRVNPCGPIPDFLISTWFITACPNP